MRGFVVVVVVAAAVLGLLVVFFCFCFFVCFLFIYLFIYFGGGGFSSFVGCTFRLFVPHLLCLDFSIPFPHRVLIQLCSVSMSMAVHVTVHFFLLSF